MAEAEKASAASMSLHGCRLSAIVAVSLFAMKGNEARGRGLRPLCSAAFSITRLTVRTDFVRFDSASWGSIEASLFRLGSRAASASSDDCTSSARRSPEVRGTRQSEKLETVGIGHINRHCGKPVGIVNHSWAIELSWSCGHGLELRQADGAETDG